jgi:uncharacterized protein (TIGR00290 family)
LDAVLKQLKIDALLLGGIGLQKTQIKAIEKVARKYKIKVIVPHRGMDHFKLIKEAIIAGFDIRITSIASDGLGPEWLGRKLDSKTLDQLRKLSERYGFHIGGEGGYYDTFVFDGPIFKKRIEIINSSKIWDTRTQSGYLIVKDAKLAPK